MKFEYETRTEWYGKYVTVSKMFAVVPKEALASIIKDEEKEESGLCGNPCLIYWETEDGDCCSEFFDELIDKLGAKEYGYYDDEEEEDIQ